MRKNRKRSFDELVIENKMQILKDREEMERIERKIEEKRMKRAE